jgi:hypothetical protein
VSNNYLSQTPRRGSGQKSGGVTWGAKQTSKRNTQSSLPTHLLTGSWLLAPVSRSRSWSWLLAPWSCSWLLLLVLLLSSESWPYPGVYANNAQQNKAKQTGDNKEKHKTVTNHHTRPHSTRQNQPPVHDAAKHIEHKSTIQDFQSSPGILAQVSRFVLHGNSPLSRSQGPGTRWTIYCKQDDILLCSKRYVNMKTGKNRAFDRQG